MFLVDEIETRQKSSEDYWKRLDKDVSDLGIAFTLLFGRADSSEKTLKTLFGKQEKIENYMLEMNEKYDSIVAMLAKLSVSKDKQFEGTNSGCSNEGGDVSIRSGGEGRMSREIYDGRWNIKLPKIDFPHLEGKIPENWLEKLTSVFRSIKYLRP
ncbi:Uncharacterized protein Adt_41817 [Abeliophyllum distichum]|uniref:Uncharacterized protein n=1 Tax=Abeliophyllum distichum TaxID=126358 RepID=A0ABD1PPX1_9LAMI